MPTSFSTSLLPSSYFRPPSFAGFPLVQLPKKFRAAVPLFPLSRQQFPLVQLPKKFRAESAGYPVITVEFPLVQLPKKFRAPAMVKASPPLVSISSTSEEV